MNITVNDLIQMLKDLPDEVKESEIRIAQQPNYPLAGNFDGIAVDDDGNLNILSGPATEYASKKLWEDAEQNNW